MVAKPLLAITDESDESDESDDRDWEWDFDELDDFKEFNGGFDDDDDDDDDE